MLDISKQAPKIIIIEGPDNCGKDTLISKLNEHFIFTKIIHSGIPDSADLFNFYYNGLIHDTLAGYYDSSLKAVIHNRSIYGEYVYGPKYRQESKEEISKLVHNLETGQLRTFILSRDLYFILLTSSDSDLLVMNDDGLSYSSNKSDIEGEIIAFDEIFNLSQIENKRRIYINDGNHFRPKDDIYREALSFIYSTYGD